MDNDIYTEHYRTKNPGEQGQTEPQCQIGQIFEIKEKIRLFYRPGDPSCSVCQKTMSDLFSEDTNLDLNRVKQGRIILVYGSPVEVDIDFKEEQDV